MELHIGYQNNKYYVFENEEHCDEEGNYGMGCFILGEFSSYAEAEDFIKTKTNH